MFPDGRFLCLALSSCLSMPRGKWMGAVGYLQVAVEVLRLAVHVPVRPRVVRPGLLRLGKRLCAWAQLGSQIRCSER
jgi:hypothetical protein